jgi:DNA-binding transcriptional regulator YdaS (Cro superfamily)
MREAMVASCSFIGVRQSSPLDCRMVARVLRGEVLKAFLSRVLWVLHKGSSGSFSHDFRPDEGENVHVFTPWMDGHNDYTIDDRA